MSFFHELCYYERDWLSFQSHESSISCVFCGVLLLDSSNIFFKCLLVSPWRACQKFCWRAHGSSPCTRHAKHFANVLLCSSFPVQAAPPYSPAGMDGSAGFPARGQSSGQNLFYTSADNRDGGSNSLQNGPPNGAQPYTNFMSPRPSGGPASPGFGQPDFGGAFSQQFPPSQ
jgi:hypothetical protein